jgi:uncharacterized alkaline shock family protein YloU
MHKEDSHTDLGAVRIHDNVIASIASIAAAEIEGVKSIGRISGISLLDLINKKFTRSIKVEKDKNGDISIEVPLIIKYNYNVPEISGKVQESIRNALEKMTNINIKDIDITIQGIERG